MSDAQPPCTRGESHRFKMPPEQNAMPWEQEIIRLKQQLAEAQQARERAEALMEAAVMGKATAERHVVKVVAERDTLRGLLREVPHDSNCHSLKERHLPGMTHYITDSDDEICPPFHYAKGKCSCHVQRITAALKEGE